MLRTRCGACLSLQDAYSLPGRQQAASLEDRDKERLKEGMAVSTGPAQCTQALQPPEAGRRPPPGGVVGPALPVVGHPWSETTPALVPSVTSCHPPEQRGKWVRLSTERQPRAAEGQRGQWALGRAVCSTAGLAPGKHLASGEPFRLAGAGRRRSRQSPLPRRLPPCGEPLGSQGHALGTSAVQASRDDVRGCGAREAHPPAPHPSRASAF